jgi:dihydropteroate synthase
LPNAPAAPTRFRCGRFEFSLERPLLMGVLNLTPDSFSDGGSLAGSAQAVARARQMVDEGADLIDVGAESTRPGAPSVSVREELARLEPVVGALLGCGVPISIDTRKPEVMRAMLALGADMINDVAGFRTPEAVDAIVDSRAACCVMHMLGDPATMQQAPSYRDVVADVRDFLQARAGALVAAGVARERIVIDPGIGFGKTLAHNLQLLSSLDVLAADGLPVLAGVSRKSMIGALTGRVVSQRLAGSLAAMLAAAARGARILRVHDVAESRDALEVWRAIDAGR